MLRRRVSIALTMVLGLSLAAPVPPSGAARSRLKAAGSASEGFRWDPASRVIGKGDRIVWTNPTGTNHTVTAYRGRWRKNATIRPGERTRKKFRRRGTFKFRCLVRGHSAINNGRCVGMCGKIVVR